MRLIGLDLQGVMTPDHPALGFAERELASATEPWIVVAAHYPFYSASRHGNRGDLQQHLLPLLLRHEVDLVVVGHDHNYQRFGDPADPRDVNDQVVLVISGGGGKSLYDLNPHERLRASHRGYQHCVVNVDGLRLELRAKSVSGEELDTVVLDKRARIDSGALALDSEDARDRRIAALR